MLVGHPGSYLRAWGFGVCLRVFGVWVCSPLGRVSGLETIQDILLGVWGLLASIFPLLGFSKPRVFFRMCGLPTP